jgi:hypothetical protein
MMQINVRPRGFRRIFQGKFYLKSSIGKFPAASEVFKAMVDDFSKNIRKITWKEARPKLNDCEPELVKIIDKLVSTEDETPPLLSVLYSFGGIIYTDKIVHIPTGRGFQTLPITSRRIPSEFQELLDYSPLPLCFVGNKHGVEVYHETEGLMHSISVFNEGLNLGIWEFFDEPTPYSISAGARTLMLLPKIMDQSGHDALAKIGVQSPPPHNPFDQWHIFRELANYHKFATPWHSEIIFFTKKWADKIHNDPKWLPFKLFVLKRAWDHTRHNRYKFIFDDMWESFAKVLSLRKIKPVSYVLDAFKHLTYIAMENYSLTAYTPTVGEETLAPTKEILRIFLEEYDLENLAPTLMLPTHFSLRENQLPVYYSWQIPTHWNLVPRSRDSTSTKRDLDYLVWLDNAFRDALATGKLRIAIDKVYDVFEKVEFKFFHTDGDADGTIRPSSLMATEDNRLLYVPGNKAKYGKRDFAARSTFARGCIRISLKKQ